jgi:hypothetical protein
MGCHEVWTFLLVSPVYHSDVSLQCPRYFQLHPEDRRAEQPPTSLQKITLSCLTCRLDLPDEFIRDVLLFPSGLASAAYLKEWAGFGNRPIPVRPVALVGSSVMFLQHQPVFEDRRELTSPFYDFWYTLVSIFHIWVYVAPSLLFRQRHPHQRNGPPRVCRLVHVRPLFLRGNRLPYQYQVKFLLYVSATRPFINSSFCLHQHASHLFSTSLYLCSLSLFPLSGYRVFFNYVRPSNARAAPWTYSHSSCWSGTRYKFLATQMLLHILSSPLHTLQYASKHHLLS